MKSFFFLGYGNKSRKSFCPIGEDKWDSEAKKKELYV